LQQPGSLTLALAAFDDARARNGDDSLGVSHRRCGYLGGLSGTFKVGPSGLRLGLSTQPLAFGGLQLFLSFVNRLHRLRRTLLHICE
jgi:hypothetical protein